jgi:hypothetical protein
MIKLGIGHSLCQVNLVLSFYFMFLRGIMISQLPSFISLTRLWLEHHTNLWLRPLVVIGVLLLSIGLGYKARPDHLKLIPGLIIGIGMVLIFMRWPPTGLIAIIGSIAIIFNGPSNSNATMALVALLFGLWLIGMILQREVKLVPRGTIWPLLSLVFVASLAFGVGQLPWYTFAQSAPLGAQLGGLSLFFLSAAAFLLVAHQVRDVRWLEWMTWLFLALGALFIAGRLVPGVGRLTPYLFNDASTGSLFWTWLVALAFSQAMLNRKLNLGWRLVLAGLVMATFYEAFVHGYSWKSGWLPPLASVMAIILFRFWRLGIILAPLGVIPASRLLSRAISSDQYSYGTRVDAWNIVLEIVRVNPILGLGPANYRWYTPLFPIRGWAVQFNSHSQYIDLIAQTGILGLACFLWFFGAVGWLGWQLRYRIPEGFARAYVYGALGGVVGTLTAAALGDWVIPFFYNINLGGFRASMLSWLFLGGLVALEQIYKRELVSHQD